MSVDPMTADANTGANFNRYWYANNNPYRFTDPDGRLANFAFGAAAGMIVELAVQVGVQGKSFSQIDVSDVLVAGAVGAATSGVGAAAALAAARSTVTVGQAVVKTAAASGGLNAAGSIAKSVANGENVSGAKVIAEGALGAVGGAAGAKLALAPLAKLNNMAAKGGLNPHVANATKAAIFGSDKAVVTSATSATDAKAGELLNAGIEAGKADAERDR